MWRSHNGILKIGYAWDVVIIRKHVMGGWLNLKVCWRQKHWVIYERGCGDPNKHIGVL